MIRTLLFIALAVVIMYVVGNVVDSATRYRLHSPRHALVSQPKRVAYPTPPAPKEMLAGRDVKPRDITVPLPAKIVNLKPTAFVTEMGPPERPDIARMRRDIQSGLSFKDTMASVAALPEVFPDAETIPVSEDTLPPPFDSALVEEAPDKLSRMVGSAFLVIHTPDTFQIPQSWKGAEVAAAALKDAVWSEHGGAQRGWAIKDAMGRKYMVPKIVLARIVRSLEDKSVGDPPPLYRVDVFLNSEDIVDVRLEYF